MHEECERHNLIGCALCHKTTYQVRRDALDAADKAAKEARKAQRAANRQKRQERRETPKEDRGLIQSKTDRNRNPYKGYAPTEKPTYGHFAPHPAKADKATVTAEKPENGQKPSNYWGWAILDNSL